MKRRVTVGLFKEPELVRTGVSELLLNADGVVAGQLDRHVDLVLVDPFPPMFNSPSIALKRIHSARRQGKKLLGYTWKLTPMNRAFCLQSGCIGVASKDWDGPSLASYIRSVVEKPENAADTVRLSERQLSIARGVASGMSNAEIAEKVICSVETVKTEIQRLTSTRRLRNRAHLASWVVASGLMAA